MLEQKLILENLLLKNDDLSVQFFFFFFFFFFFYAYFYT